MMILGKPAYFFMLGFLIYKMRTVLSSTSEHHYKELSELIYIKGIEH